MIWLAVFLFVGISSASTAGAVAPEMGAVMFFLPGGTVILILLLVSWGKTFTTVQVFEDRVEVLNRFLVKNSRRIEASKIESVDYSQSLLGRSRYGTLVVRGSGNQAIQLNPLRNPEQVAEAIRGISDKSSSKANSAPEELQDTSTSSLAELIKMKEAGHLSEQEFSAAKQKLLG